MVSVVGLVEAEVGTRAELHCEASGVPLPNPMEWSFNGRPVFYFIYFCFSNTCSASRSATLAPES